MSTNPGARTALAFVTCSVIWGSTFLAIRAGNDTVPPLWAATLRLGLATVMLVPLAVFTGGGLPRDSALRAAAGYGLLQFGGNFPLLYWAETIVPSGMAAVVFATVPLTSSLLARGFGLERLDRARVFGALVAVAGMGVLFADQVAGHVPLRGLVAVFASTLLAALGTIVLKLGPRQPALGANAVGAAIGALVCLALSFGAREAHAIPTRWVQIAPILYLAIAGSVVAFVVFTWLVHHWDVSRVAFIGVVAPVLAVMLGIAVRHETLSRGSLAGAALVLAGVVLGVGVLRRRQPAAPSPRA
jgi:drug/metabolite transporter (DMT)-like permease